MAGRGVQIHTFADDEVLDVRAPSYAEMNRWLSTLNMHTTLLLRDRRHSSLSNIAAGTNTSASAALAWSRRSSASIAELAPPKVCPRCTLDPGPWTPRALCTMPFTPTLILSHPHPALTVSHPDQVPMRQVELIAGWLSVRNEPAL